MDFGIQYATEPGHLRVQLTVGAACLLPFVAACSQNPSTPDPNVFATQGTGAWQPLPPIPQSDSGLVGSFPGGAAHLFWTGQSLLAVSVDGFSQFDPASNTWTVIAATGGLLPSQDSDVIWTGRSILVFGGSGCGAAWVCPIAESLQPATGQVTSLSLQGAPSFRAGATSMWTGTKMVVWEGHGLQQTATVWYADGAMYDPASDTWTPMSPAPGPNSVYLDPGAVWTGSQMLVWGGLQGSPGPASNAVVAPPSGLSYDPSHDAWAALPSQGQPSSRGGHVALWDGTEMIVWGGAAYDASQGGYDTMHPFADGAAYNPATHAWRPISSAPATGLFNATAVWTGTEMLVWGGYAEYPCGADCVGSNYGYRYNPATDTWQYITTVDAPGPRVANGAVWTGQSLVIWGGETVGDLHDGAVWTP